MLISLESPIRFFGIADFRGRLQPAPRERDLCLKFKETPSRKRTSSPAKCTTPRIRRDFEENYLRLVLTRPALPPKVIISLHRNRQSRGWPRPRRPLASSCIEPSNGRLVSSREANSTAKLVTALPATFQLGYLNSGSPGASVHGRPDLLLSSLPQEPLKPARPPQQERSHYLHPYYLESQCAQ